MPGGDDIMTRWKIGEREAAIIAGDREVAGFQHNEIALHPRMDVAPDGDELLVIVGVGERRRAWGLHFIPFAIDFSEGMNVVSKRISVGNFDFLANPNCENVCGVVATFLVESCRRRMREWFVVDARGNIDHDVAKSISGTDENGFGEEWIGGVHLYAFCLF